MTFEQGNKHKPKTLKTDERLERSWKLALEFGVGYPVGQSEREKLIDPSPIRVHCSECGRQR